VPNGLLDYNLAMLALEIIVNGKKRCVAGVKQTESLSAIVAISPHGPFLSVSGSIGPNGDIGEWVKLESVALGDKITVKVVDVPTSDEPISVKRFKKTIK
jgi:hypothetical protein